ncbi:hypothetical protein FACS1894193_00440 [Bacilli bacterium]|nr:hypothetical protein FACS1894193_00440 [Bacilli bacterium]GHU46093.1 hypothetical protein FACS1894194_3170 [Bacilli bacterium]
MVELKERETRVIDNTQDAESLKCCFLFKTTHFLIASHDIFDYYFCYKWAIIKKEMKTVT